MNTDPPLLRLWTPALAVVWLLTSVLWCPAATFNGAARVEVTDTTGGLSWNTSAGVLTVQCWFKLAVPSGTNLTENMTILSNRRGGTTNDPHAFLIEYDIYTGNIEFSTKGNLHRRFPVIERPFLERWYHVAVVRQAEEFYAYVDGRAIAVPTGPAVGDTRSTDGLSIGGWNASGSSGRYLFGEVQEVSIYHAFFDAAFISQNMFVNQPAISELKGYFRLACSTNASETLTNSAPVPVPAGTELATKQGAGTVDFEETNQAGEQSAFDARRNGGRDALAPLSGAFAWEQTTFARPTPGIAFDFRIGYSSANVSGGAKLGGIDPYAAGPLGKGWRHTFETRVVPAQTFSPLSDKDTLGLLLWNGALETWALDPGLGEYRPRDKEYRGELVITTTNCQWTTPERMVYVFKRPDTGSAVMRGRLLEIRDFSGNKVKVQWDEIRGRITNVVDSASGDYAFDTNSLIKSVSFGAWQVNFAYDATNRLISKTLTNTSGFYAVASNLWQFQYDTNGLLARIVDPRGNTNTTVQYDQYGRQTNQVDALGRATATRYGVPGKRQITRIDPGTNSWIETFDRKGHILAQQDPLTNITRYTYDERGNRTSITEPLGWTTVFGYDNRANVVARTNALGEVTRWVFHSFFNKAIQQITPQPADANGWTTWTNFYAYDAGGNLTNHSDALGSLVRYTYRTNGLVETSTDANGHVSRFTYDTNGFLIARTDPANSTWHFTVNDVGWKLREENPLGDPTACTLDLNGNPIRVQDVLGRIFQNTYDANGNLLSSSDGKGQLTTHAYDAANQRTHTTDRTGTNQWLTFYTPRGKVNRVTDPLGNSVTNFYDAANRLIRVSDPLGNSVTHQYDANGNLTALTDKAGQRWIKTYDRLNRAIAEADPLGNTKQTAFDAAGRILQITTPNGYPSTHAYDGRGRLTQWTDPEGFHWLYAYDGVANITNITDALGGHYIMAYGPRNERLLERNQDGFEWRYAYDELLRLKQQTDPNGTTRTPTYDAAGRVLFVDFSTGRRDSYAYDPNNNPQKISRRAAGVSTTTLFIYDALDRPVEQTDALAQTVKYGYDPLGRVTAITYPGSKTLTNRYDPLGRLTNQVDWAGRQMTYAYDQADRLIRRSYTNGVVQTNTFDSAGRLTSLSHLASSIPTSSNQVAIALSYAYDRNGNKVGNTERGTFAWPMPTLTDETAAYTAAGRLKTRSITNTGTNAVPSPGGEGQGEGETISYAYDPSGNMTNAVRMLGGTNAESWTLTYDEDNRTTSICWSPGVLCDKTIVNRYDALGRRIARTVDGVTNGYVLSLVGGMERVLCDLNSSGAVTAWYVHGPDLCYKVDGANNLTCYHADAQANIIALTGAGGTNLAQYAYTPYGRSLGSFLISNLQSQVSGNPYTFVGSQGVMEELPGLYFMRARYYSADAGVFLSTDPVKKIGPGWKPVAYAYADNNPITLNDPNGEFVSYAAAFLEGLGEGLVAGILFDVGKAASEELLARAGVSRQAFAIADGFFDTGKTAYEGWKVIKIADPTLHGAASFAGNEVGGYISGAVVNAFLNAKPLSQVQPLANNPFTRAASGASAQTQLQSWFNSPQIQQVKDVVTGDTKLITAPGASSKPNSPMVSGAVTAINRGETLNNGQKTNPVGNSNGSGTTTQTSSNAGSSSTGGGFSATVNKVTTAVNNAATTITTAVTNVTSIVVQTVSNWASSAWSFITGRRP